MPELNDVAVHGILHLDEEIEPLKKVNISISKETVIICSY